MATRFPIRQWSQQAHPYRTGNLSSRPCGQDENEYTPFPHRFQAGNAVFANCARGILSDGSGHAPPKWRLSMRRSRGERVTIGRSKLRPSRRPRQARPLPLVVSMSHVPPAGLRSLVSCPHAYALIASSGHARVTASASRRRRGRHAQNRRNWPLRPNGSRRPRQAACRASPPRL